MSVSHFGYSTVSQNLTNSFVPLVEIVAYIVMFLLLLINMYSDPSVISVS